MTNGKATMEFQFSTITRVCVCGLPFTPIVFTQQYHSRSCQIKHSRNAARATKRQAHDLNFIGIDGEGVNVIKRDGSKEHRYVMLSMGDATLWKNGAALTHLDIFPFLYDNFDPANVYVGFYLAYDFTFWLKSLSEKQAWFLFSPAGIALRKRKSAHNPVPFPVYVDDWEIDILGMRRFKLRPRVKVKNPYPWLYVCDTGAYYQASFLSVIEPSEKNWPHGTAPCSHAEYKTIEIGKGSRGNDTLEDDTSWYDDMLRYNQLENTILARMMRTLNNGFVASGVRLDRTAFYGPGQAIQKWLDAQPSAFIGHRDIEATVPHAALEAAWNSYYGGRFEIAYHGHVPGPAYEYDVTSAYPYAMQTLPCLCGTWKQGTGMPPTLSIVYVYGSFIGQDHSLGALPLRNAKGNILYPRQTIGWYIWDEVLAARKAGLISNMSIMEWIGYDVQCDHGHPLAALGELFSTRLAVGKATPQGKALKLMLNSAYGKFAQSIGQPKYGNPVYASLITSKCRQMILEAIGTHPNGSNDVLMIATDGIYFRSPHTYLDSLPDKERLGGWERVDKTNLCLMKPGVYWDDTVREQIRTHKKLSLKSRGISAKILAENIGRIDEVFRDVYDSSLQTPMPKMRIEAPFTVTSPKLALHRNKWHTAGAVTWDQTREDSASIAPKRHAPYIDKDCIRSLPMIVPNGTLSTPYDKRFGFEIQETLEESGITEEGYLNDIVAQTFNSL